MKDRIKINAIEHGFEFNSKQYDEKLDTFYYIRDLKKRKLVVAIDDLCRFKIWRYLGRDRKNGKDLFRFIATHNSEEYYNEDWFKEIKEIIFG